MGPTELDLEEGSSSPPRKSEIYKCKIANIKVQWMNFLVSNAIFALSMVSLIGSNKRLSASLSYDAVRFQMVAYCCMKRGNLKKKKANFSAYYKYKGQFD